MGLSFGALPGYGLLVQSNLNQLDFFTEARIIHEDVDLGHPDKPKYLLLPYTKSSKT